jgi:hypothetical protein
MKLKTFGLKRGFSTSATFFFTSPRWQFSINALIDFYDKVPSTHIGNTILVYHNPMKTMKNPIENVMLVEKWNQ